MRRGYIILALAVTLASLILPGASATAGSSTAQTNFNLNGICYDAALAGSNVVYLCGDPLPDGQSSAGVLGTASADSPGVPYSLCGQIQNVAPPTISGTPQPGGTLQASPGSWTDQCYQIISFSYSWNRGGSSPSYNVTDADVGQPVYVTVTACDTEGNCASASSGAVTIQPNPTPTPPPPPPTVSINANPQTVAYGGTSTINWSSSNASSCFATDGPVGWYGNRAISGSWTTPALTVQTTATITCSGNGTSAYASVIIYVGGPPPATVTLTASPNPTPYGQNTTVSWSSQNSTGCSAAWTTSTAASGSASVGPITADTTLPIDCGGAGGNGSASVLVQVSGAPPDTTAPSTPGTPSLASSTATSLTTQWLGSTDNVAVTGYGLYLNGSLVSTTTATSYTFSGLACGMTYTLSVDAYDAAGNRSTKASASAGTTACPITTPPTVTLVASATTIAGGDSTTLSWSAINANSCQASWTTSSVVSGQQAVTPPATTDYSISCTGPIGTASSNAVTVTVIDAQALSPNAGGSFSVDQGTRTLSGGTPCRNTHVIYTYRNFFTQYVYFRWELSETFCWKWSRVTAVYNQTAFSVESHYPWNFDGNVSPPSTGGINTYIATTFAQGKYEACAAFGIGCLRAVAPYARIYAHGDGTASFQYGVG